MKRQPKSSSIKTFITPIFREVKNSKTYIYVSVPGPPAITSSQNTWIMFCMQLKEQRRVSGSGVCALEELENAFSLAEESSPGISDCLLNNIMERVCR